MLIICAVSLSSVFVNFMSVCLYVLSLASLHFHSKNNAFRPCKINYMFLVRIFQENDGRVRFFISFFVEMKDAGF